MPVRPCTERKTSLYSLGTAMVSAAEQKVDATPMEGFNA
jgi:hypothetical protein